MNEILIFEGSATLEDLCELHRLGYDFICEDGKVARIFKEKDYEKNNCSINPFLESVIANG